MTKSLIKRQPTDLIARPSIGLALGGGGARGLSHILMLEALEELGVRPKIIAGTSIGAVYGAAFASGLSAAEIRSFTEELLGARFDLIRQLFSARAEPVMKLLKVLPVRGALLNAESLVDIVLPDNVALDFAGLATPLKVVATNYYRQEQEVFTQGPLRTAIAASIALPAIFSPVMIGGQAYMDGGLVNPLPFDLISGCDVSVAINVSGVPRNNGATNGGAGKPPSAITSLVSSSQIFQNSIIREKLKSLRPDVYINVDVDRFHVLEFHKLNQVLAAAAPAKEQLKRQLGEALEAHGRPHRRSSAAAIARGKK